MKGLTKEEFETEYIAIANTNFNSKPWKIIVRALAQKAIQSSMVGDKLDSK